MCSEDMCMQVSQFTGTDMEGLVGACIFQVGRGAPGVAYGREYASKAYAPRDVQY